MIRLLLVLISLSMSFLSVAQSDWYQPGTKWWYNVYQNNFPFNITQTYTIIEVTKDTIIHGKACSEIKFGRTDTLLIAPTYYYFGLDSLIYIYEENRKVYIYHSYSQKFNLLYDFNANVGDSWKVKNMCDSINYPNTYDDSLNFIVDSVSYININGNNLKLMHLKFTGGPSYSVLLERIGLIGTPYWEDLGICRGIVPEGVPYPLKCYEDPVIGLYHHSNFNSCDTIIVIPWNGIQESDRIKFQIYPNPVTDKVNIEFNSERLGDIQVKVWDIHGREVYKAKINGTDRITFSTVDWPGGIYFLEITKDRVRQGGVKLIVQ